MRPAKKGLQKKKFHVLPFFLIFLITYVIILPTVSSVHRVQGTLVRGQSVNYHKNKLLKPI